MEENKIFEAKVVVEKSDTTPTEEAPRKPKPQAKKSKISFSTIFGAALLAVVVGGVVKLLLWMGLFSVVGSFSSGSTVVVPEEAILKIDFAESILDAPSKDPMAGFDFASMTTTQQLTLYKTLVAIEAAKEDERIKGIYINITGGGAGYQPSLRACRADL